MGRVLLARQRSLHRDVAVKIVKPRCENDGALQRLLFEAVVTGSLEHPAVMIGSCGEVYWSTGGSRRG
jgi:hypothetical protein